MTEDQLRQLVRDAVARHLDPSAMIEPNPDRPAWKTHASHARFVLPIGRDLDGPCLIQPEVRCTHCGYCQSWGH
jgi:hypothetical protein